MQARTAKPTDNELAAALAEARKPLRHQPLPSASLRVRLTTSPALRRLLPTRLVAAQAQLRGRAIWRRDAAVRATARELVLTIVANTPRASELDELARAHVIEEQVNKALFWQPWRENRMDERSREHLRSALSDGRGVVLSACHLGPMFAQVAPISTAGRIVFATGAPWFFEKPSADYWGRRVAHWNNHTMRRDERTVCSVGAFPVLSALLSEGEIVMLYFDMPGSRRTRFLGKPVTLATGTARLAKQANALILPARTRRVGHRIWSDFSEPLDPRDYASWEELHDAIAGVHARTILELAATLEDPNRPGAWEGGASEREWAKPGTGERERAGTPVARDLRTRTTSRER